MTQTDARHITYCPAASVTGPDLPSPPNRQPHSGWRVVPVSAKPATLDWSGETPAGSGRLRITVGIGFRECKRVEAVCRRSRARLGTFDLRFAPSPQPFELRLTSAQCEMAMREGVELSLTEGSEPLWILSGDSSRSPVPAALQPHLCFDSDQADPLSAFLDQMTTLASIQLFGWMEGCVVDGLLALHGKLPSGGYDQAARRHLAEFCLPDGRLVYAGAHSEPVVDQIHSIEETLMFASIARRLPSHPSLAIARAFWGSRYERFGFITDPGMPSAEGCYTVGYPLAVYANVMSSPHHADLAINELRVRMKRLAIGETLYLRSYDDGRQTFPNWSRGVGWYFLGLVKTLAELRYRTDIGDLREEAHRLAAWTLKRRTDAGIWNCFVGDSTTLPDTAGSSGIAAALAFGAAHDLFDAATRSAASDAVDTLVSYLTPDGLLTGVSQSNCGGEALQRGEYRVIFPMGMGLLAQAFAWC